MKNSALLFILFFISVYVNAQNVAINLSGNTGSSSAIVDLSDASNKNLGFLMTNVALLSATDIATVPNPPAGMIVWNTNDAMPFGVGFYYWSGTTWLYISNSGTSGLADLTAGTGITSFTYNGTSAQTISIASTGVTSGVYGSATTVPTYTVNAEGQLTQANDIPIDIADLAPLNTGPLGAVLSSSPTNTAAWTAAPSADNLVLLSNTAGVPTWGSLPPSITANNGLTMSTVTNVQLGGALVTATNITQAGYALDISGGTIGLNDGTSTASTNINTGTSTGAVNIGNGTNTTITGNGNVNINANNGTATTNINTGTSTGAVVIGNNTGFTGINQPTPLTTLDINGGFSTDVSSTIPSIPSSSTTYTITVGNSSFIQFTSSVLYAEACPFTLGPGVQTGQRLVLELNSPTTSGAELLNGTYVSLLNSPILFGTGTGNITAQSIELVWNGSVWVDLGTNKTTDTREETFSYTGGNQVWTCPSGVTSVLVKAWGAGGAGSNDNNSANGGGGGAYVEGTVALTAGTQYTIVVGGGGTTAGTSAFGGGGEGTGSDAAGGGGGYSGLFATSVAQANALVIAGGGGGGANGNGASYGLGGGGGAPTGGTGTGTPCSTETGGGGATTGAGGTAGSGGCSADNGVAGTTLTGANAGGASTNNKGGAGGGGYYGGGSGGCYYGGGGGGGSSYISGTTISMQAGATGTHAGDANPGGTADPAYQSGIGIGSYGTTPAGTVGGNGLVIIYY